MPVTTVMHRVMSDCCLKVNSHNITQREFSITVGLMMKFFFNEIFFLSSMSALFVIYTSYGMIDLLFALH